jgi:hypothetical protein
VLQRFSGQQIQREGEFLNVTYRLQDVQDPLYIRARGTNSNEVEPTADPAGEDPWDDLWFYSNPVFVSVLP